MRVTIYLEQEEREALTHLAQRERRDPRDQAALMIREDLQRRGLLPVETAILQSDRAGGTHGAN